MIAPPSNPPSPFCALFPSQAREATEAAEARVVTAGREATEAAEAVATARQEATEAAEARVATAEAGREAAEARAATAEAGRDSLGQQMFEARRLATDAEVVQLLGRLVPLPLPSTCHHLAPAFQHDPPHPNPPPSFPLVCTSPSAPSGGARRHG